MHTHALPHARTHICIVFFLLLYTLVLLPHILLRKPDSMRLMCAWQGTRTLFTHTHTLTLMHGFCLLLLLYFITLTITPFVSLIRNCPLPLPLLTDDSFREFVGDQTMLTPESSERILSSTRPMVIFNGHDHEGCYYVHTHNGRDIPEYAFNFSLVVHVMACTACVCVLLLRVYAQRPWHSRVCMFYKHSKICVCLWSVLVSSLVVMLIENHHCHRTFHDAHVPYISQMKENHTLERHSRCVYTRSNSMTLHSYMLCLVLLLCA